MTIEGRACSDLSRRVLSHRQAVWPVGMFARFNTFHDLFDALSAIPRRVAGQGNYNQHRNICWAVVDACHQAGYSDETAVDLLEAWSPSKQCGWDISQIVRSGGAQITAATLFHHAINNGWRRCHDD